MTSTSAPESVNKLIKVSCFILAGLTFLIIVLVGIRTKHNMPTQTSSHKNEVIGNDHTGMTQKEIIAYPAKWTDKIEVPEGYTIKFLFNGNKGKLLCMKNENAEKVILIGNGEHANLAKDLKSLRFMSASSNEIPIAVILYRVK